jgi:hypothetical protein
MRVSGRGIAAAMPYPAKEEAMALRDKMAASAAPYMRPGEPVQAIFAGQTASQFLAARTCSGLMNQEDTNIFARVNFFG